MVKTLTNLMVISLTRARSSATVTVKRVTFFMFKELYILPCVISYNIIHNTVGYTFAYTHTDNHNNNNNNNTHNNTHSDITSHPPTTTTPTPPSDPDNGESADDRYMYPSVHSAA